MPDKTFEIAIKTTADPSGAQLIDRELDKVGEHAGEGGPGGGFDPINLQRQRDINAETAAEDAAANAQAVEREAVEERRNSILQQRQALITSEIEALELEGAGQTEQAAALNAEINERRVALSIQQSTNLSEEQSLLLARQRITAEEQIGAAQLAQKEASLLAGVNIGKARQEATTLAREIATGSVNMRTVGALAGSLGPALGVAAISGVVVAGVIGEIGKKMDESRITAEKESVEFQKQAEHWRQMAASAKDFSDVQKLTEEVSRRVTEINEKARQLPSEVGGGFWATELNGLKLYANLLGGNFKTSTDEAIETQRQLAEQVQATGNIFKLLAERRAEFFQSLGELPLTKQIAELQGQIEALVETQKTLDRSNTDQNKQWEKLQIDVDGYGKFLEGLEKKQSELVKTSASLNEELKKLNFDNLSKPEQLKSLASDLETVRSKLHDLRVAAATPAETLARVGTEISEHANKVKGLVVEWEKLQQQQKQTAEEATKEHDKELAEIDKLQKKVAELRNTVLTVGDPGARQKAVDELEKVEQQLNDVLKKAKEPVPKGAGLEKWLLDIIADAKTTTIELGNAQRALQALYKAQGQAPNPAAPFGGDPKNYIPGPTGPIYVNPLPGSSDDSGGDRKNYIPGPTGPIYVNPLPGSSSSGEQNAVSQHADSVKVEIAAMASATADGFKDIASSVKEMHAKISREVATAKQQIDQLWQNV